MLSKRTPLCTAMIPARGSPASKQCAGCWFPPACTHRTCTAARTSGPSLWPCGYSSALSQGGLVQQAASSSVCHVLVEPGRSASYLVFALESAMSGSNCQLLQASSNTLPLPSSCCLSENVVVASGISSSDMRHPACNACDVHAVEVCTVQQ